MRITAARERTIPIRSALRNARVSFAEITATIVAVVTDSVVEGERVIGYAFNSFGRYACGGPLRERFIPRLLNAAPADILDDSGGNFDPERILRLLLRNEKAGAHAERSMSLGTLELALWDAVAKIERRPLYRVISARYGDGLASAHVPCYVGGGFYAGGDPVRQLTDELKRHLDAGYTQVKIKAGGLPLDADRARIEAALSLVNGGGNLALDLSCAFERREALAFAKAVEPYALRWLEEPCEPEDFDTYRALRDAYGGVLAGGENLFSAQEVRNFLRYGDFSGRLVLQPDPALAYGLGEFVRMRDIAESFGVARAQLMPHGGNLMSLHIAAGLGLGSAESYPGLFGDFSGFGDEVEINQGYATLPQRPGIGFEAQPGLFRHFSDLAQGA